MLLYLLFEVSLCEWLDSRLLIRAYSLCMCSFLFNVIPVLQFLCKTRFLSFIFKKKGDVMVYAAGA